MLRLLYTLLFIVALPAVLLRLLWRSRKMPAYRHRWAERLSLINPPSSFKQGLWIHAVSLGETIAITPLIKKFLADGLSVTVTTTTITGSQQVVKTFGTSVYHAYLPYDIPMLIRRFLHRLQPIMLVIMETELWPNVLHCCQQQSIPVVLTNARLSQRSAHRYAKIATLTKAMLQSLTALAVHAKPDALRFIELGANANKITITGNLKFDMTVNKARQQSGVALKAQWGDRPVWIAASTHKGEDEQLLQAHHQLQQQFPTALLILVPRHPERFDTVYQLCQTQFSTVRRSRVDESINSSTHVYLGDTMGELQTLFSASDVAFIGGSLVPIGGHNVLEAVAVGVPTLVGCYTANFKTITEDLIAAGATCRVNDLEQLVTTLALLLSNPEQCHQRVKAGNQVLQANRGALQQQFLLIKKIYEQNR